MRERDDERPVREIDVLATRKEEEKTGGLVFGRRRDERRTERRRRKKRRKETRKTRWVRERDGWPRTSGWEEVREMSIHFTFSRARANKYADEEEIRTQPIRDEHDGDTRFSYLTVLTEA